MDTVPAFASASEAMDMVHAGLGYLAAADPTAMAAETQARCLQMLEQATAMGTAARASILAAFTSGQGYSADADYSPKAWLINRTGITKGTAVAYTAWARRAAAHPEVARALAGGEISESFARTICQWTDKLPLPPRKPDHQPQGPIWAIKPDLSSSENAEMSTSSARISMHGLECSLTLSRPCRDRGSVFSIVLVGNPCRIFTASATPSVLAARAANTDSPNLRAGFQLVGGYLVRLNGVRCSYSGQPVCQLEQRSRSAASITR